MKMRLLATGMVVFLAACATTPQPLKGDFSGVTPSQARQSGIEGARVRWGGTIVDVRPLAEKTCIEILASPLSDSARPYTESPAEGRFIACKEGFIDPATFEGGREITVIGQLEGVTTQPIGEYDYHYPLVDARVVYLWEEREYRYYAYRPYRSLFYDPFLWPYPYYGYWWGGLGYPYFIPSSEEE